MAAHSSPVRVLRPALLLPAVIGCLGASAVLASPTGPRVTRGSAEIDRTRNVLEVTTTRNTIINWQRFGIRANEVTRFVQPGAQSAVLNRVARGATVINGALESNGRVFIINPNGIVFGPRAQVDAGGLVASTLNLTDANFAAGNLVFRGNRGTVVNRGRIETPAGGEVFLIGRGATNRGVISSPNGEVALAGGGSVQLVNPGTPNLRVEVAGNGQAANLGTIAANAARVGIFAGLQQSLQRQATNAVATQDGRILLQAPPDGSFLQTGVATGTGTGTPQSGFTANGPFLQNGISTGVATTSPSATTTSSGTTGATFTSTSPVTFGNTGQSGTTSGSFTSTSPFTTGITTMTTGTPR